MAPHGQHSYESRLSVMEAWYKDFAANHERERVLVEDYSPHAAFLGSLEGAVLDVGGGAGLAARFLRPEVRYVVVDPLAYWTSPEWSDFSARFRQHGPAPQLVRAYGEKLPFADGEFDAVVSFWSLNHVQDPHACVSEMLRVLRSGGSGRLVLEDMEPGWRDLLVEGASRIGARLRGRPRKARISCALAKGFGMKLAGAWQVEEDHVAIAERELRGWLAADAEVERRQWLAGYLTLDFRRRGGSRAR